MLAVPGLWDVLRGAGVVYGLGMRGGGGVSPRPKGPGGGVGRAGMLPSQRSRDKGSWSCGWRGHPFQNSVTVLKGNHGLEGGGSPLSYDSRGRLFFFPHPDSLSFLGDARMTHTGGSSPWTWEGGQHRVPVVLGGDQPHLSSPVILNGPGLTHGHPPSSLPNPNVSGFWGGGPHSPGRDDPGMEGPGYQRDLG